MSPENAMDMCHRLSARVRLATFEERLLQQTLEELEEAVSKTNHCFEFICWILYYVGINHCFLLVALRYLYCLYQLKDMLATA